MKLTYCLGGRTVSSAEKKWTDKAAIFLSGSKKYPLQTLREHLAQFTAIATEAAAAAAAARRTQEANHKANKRKRIAASEAINFSELIKVAVYEPREFTELVAIVDKADAWREEAKLYLNPTEDKQVAFKVHILQVRYQLFQPPVIRVLHCVFSPFPVFP